MPAIGSVALPEIAAKLRAVDVSSAWRLLPDVEVGIVSLPRADTADAEQVVGAAATARVVHPNTVRHRLRRIAERTGRDLDQPTALAEDQGVIASRAPIRPDIADLAPNRRSPHPTGSS